MTKLLHINGAPVYDVREVSPSRTWLAIVCRLIGHKSGWIEPIVPNPNAMRSLVWGCGRCTNTYPQEFS